MTALRDLEDIIAAMDSNPQWVEAMRSRLLTRELLQLPERVEEQTRETKRWRAESEAKSDDLKALIELAHRRLEESEARLAALEKLAESNQTRIVNVEELLEDGRVRLARLEKLVEDSQGRLAALEELSKATTARLDSLEAKTDDLADLVKAVNEQVKINTARLDSLESKTDDLADLVKAVNEQVKINTEHLKRNTNHLDRLRGFEIERQMYRRIHGLMLNNHDLYRGRVLRAVSNDARADRFARDVYDARDAELIDNAEYVRIFDTDLIAVGRRLGSDKQTYFVAESSFHVNYYDVERAMRSRAALSKVYPGVEIIAAVYGVTIGYDENLIAESNNVSVLQADPDD